MENEITITGFNNRNQTLSEKEEETIKQSDKNSISSKEKIKATNANIQKGKFVLPDLPYSYDALEPYIDKMTMEIHHTKHHAAYINNLNTILETKKVVPSSIEDILTNISQYPLSVRNNAGGHYNHSMFWKLMRSNGGGQPTGKLLEIINDSFGSFENFKSKFSETAMKIFGSGWAWLVIKNRKLEIGITPNQDNPIMNISEFKGSPLICLDVWEHAYYLKYQNKRADYINNWWSVLNWEEVAINLKEAD